MKRKILWLTQAVVFALLSMTICRAQNVKTPKRIALLVSDNYTKPVLEAVAALEDMPAFFSTEFITAQGDGQEIAKADLVLCYVHTPQTIQRFMKPMQQVVRSGGKVYALGNTPEAANYSEWGMRFDRDVDAYFENPNRDNIVRLVQFLCDRHLETNFQPEKAIHFPDYAICDWRNDSLFTDFEAYLNSQQGQLIDGPWVGIYGFRYEFVTNQNEYLKEYADSLSAAGFNVLMFYGFPLEPALHHFCMDEAGNSRVDVLINFSALPGGSPDKLAEAFEKLDVPVINAITVSQSQREWQKTTIGIPIAERILSMVRPEVMGQIQPSVVATQDVFTDSAGNYFKQKVALSGRVDNMVEKVKAWSKLCQLPNEKKGITLIYYNGHPGKHNIGASYLNVLPKSIFTILRGLQEDGYTLGDQVITEDQIQDKVIGGGRNIGTWAPGELERIVRQEQPVLLPIEEYKSWFATLDPQFQRQVIDKWGEPDSARIMMWTNERQQRFFVLPQIKFGNVHLMPQPARGWDENEEALFHDVSLPPHHQYIAFYLYLQRQEKNNALIHLGTHGTLEWLSGREAGLDQQDAPDALLGGMVNVYPYIMDNVGEGTQAKRRGGAVIIDHMTPPFQQAGLRPELRELAGVINDYTAADQKSAVLAGAHLKAINRWARKAGILDEMDIAGEVQPSDVQRVAHYLQELNEKQVPMGMHTFGISPDSAQAKLTAMAMASRYLDIPTKKREDLVDTFFNRILSSGPTEMRSLLNALNGKYVSASTGNDPLRNPDALPTGKNFYAFDPSRMPSGETYEVGRKLAEQLIAEYRQGHEGAFPDKVAYNLWSVETIRNEGIMEAQILSLLGVRPRYDASGKVRGVELVPRDSLARPRVDVVITPSGLYRDMFPQMMDLLDQAVGLAYSSREEDNAVRMHVDRVESQLVSLGISDAKIRRRLALVRLFGAASGSYGIGIDNAVQASDTWDDPQEIANIYFKRSGHLYGQGFWGTDEQEITELDGKDLALSIFQEALSGTKAVVHSRSSNVYGALDNDDFFQYLGGMALAIKSIDGAQPDIMVSNLTNPGSVRQESLRKFIGSELNTRYFNPAWVTQMLDEGYAGARMIGQVTDNMWGWSATTDEVITASDWQEWNDVYVADKYELDVKERFAQANNTYAYQNMLARMLEVARKEYWDPDEKTLNNLVKTYLETIEQTGLSCSDQVCGNQELLKYIDHRATHTGEISAISSLHEQLGQIQQSPNQVSGTSSLRSEYSQPRQANSSKSSSKEQTVQPLDAPLNEAPVLKGYKMEEKVLSSSAPDMKRNLNNDWDILGIIILFFLLGAVFSKDT